MGLCNLKVIKSWNRKMFALHYQTFERDENLRSTNFKEFQAADHKLWAGENGILEMINFRRMGMDEALFNSAFVRPEMAQLMQPRPISHQGGSGKGHHNDAKRRRKGDTSAPNNDYRRDTRDPPSKGDRSRKGADRKGGKNDGKGAKGGKRDRPAEWKANWVLKIDQQDVCTRFHLRGCNHTACRYSHKCPQKLRRGGICRQNHKVTECTRSEEEKLPLRSSY